MKGLSVSLKSLQTNLPGIHTPCHWTGQAKEAAAAIKAHMIIFIDICAWDDPADKTSYVTC